MANEVTPVLVLSGDHLAEIDDEQVEIAPSASAANPPVADVDPRAEQTLDVLQSALDDLLADRAYWEKPTPPSTFEAFRRLREKLHERQGKAGIYRNP